MKFVFTESNRNSILDAFRALAILLVCLLHFNFEIPYVFYEIIQFGGWMGVQLFFVLSGFLLSSIYIKSGIDRLEFPPTRTFYRNRMLRIFPLYFFSMGIYSFNACFIGGEWVELKQFIFHGLFLTNYLPERSALYLPYWSLAVEIQLYLLFPLIGFVLYRFLVRQKFIPTVLFIFLLIAFPLLYRAYICYGTDLIKQKMDYNFWIYTSSISNLDSFGWGILGALLYYYRKKAAIPYTLKMGIFGLSLILILYCFYSAHSLGGWYLAEEGVIFYSLMNMGWAGLILSLMLIESPALNKITALKPVRIIAVVSYGMYIWHGLIFEHMSKYLLSIGLQGKYYTILYFLLSSVLLMIVSLVSWRFIELPFLKRKSPKVIPSLSN